MASIYPNDVSRQALVVFRMTKGSGEFFDLSTSPITRASFEIGGYTPDENDLNQAEPYFITGACIGCKAYLAVCPQNCIEHDSLPYVIDQKHCLHCGNCYADCPVHAVIKR